MDESILRAVHQLALSSTPISLSEYREIVLRHLLTAHNNPRERYVAYSMVLTYMNMLKLEHPDWTKTCSKSGINRTEDIDLFYARHYNEGFDYGLEDTPTSHTPKRNPQLPTLISVDRYWDYPEDIFSQFAAARGYLDATCVKTEAEKLND